ncbi:MAG TPA: signal peptidase II [Acidimicrobiales bacterium]|nr:signal peptidase II [Acidimicrobiales bacterium]
MQERGTVAPLTGGRHRAVLVTAAVAAVVIAADQATTSWVLADLHGHAHLVGPLGLGLAYNSGTAFSLFSGAGDWLVPLVVVLLLGIGWLAWQTRRIVLAVAYGLVLGGALGNAGDRLFRGHHGQVVDFITLSHWPTFNVADACITVGVVLVIAVALLPRWRAPGPGPRDERGDSSTVPGARADAECGGR